MAKISLHKYYEIIDDLFARLIVHHGSISVMCTNYDICPYNLSKIKNRKRFISVGLFMYLFDTLEYHHEILLALKANYIADISLVDYLAVDNNRVYNSLLELN